MLDALLDTLALGSKEKAIYKIILERGKVAPAMVSRIAHINRTTVYSVAKDLKDRGLIVEDLGGKTLYYLPARSEELDKVIKKEKEKSDEKIATIKKLQSELTQLPQSKIYSVPKIRFIDELDIDSYLYEALTRWHESMLVSDNTWWGFQDHTFVEKFEKWIDHSWKVAPKEINLKLLTNGSEIEKKMRDKKYAEKRGIRFYPKSDFTATQWVMGDYIIYILTKEHPYYLIEIRDAVIAENTRELFKKLWNVVDYKYLV
jgi:sugar-specific transcriptional regulator TrmB